MHNHLFLFPRVTVSLCFLTAYANTKGAEQMHLHATLSEDTLGKEKRDQSVLHLQGLCAQWSDPQSIFLKNTFALQKNKKQQQQKQHYFTFSSNILKIKSIYLKKIHLKLKCVVGIFLFFCFRFNFSYIFSIFIYFFAFL